MAIFGSAYTPGNAGGGACNVSKVCASDTDAAKTKIPKAIVFNLIIFVKVKTAINPAIENIFLFLTFVG